MGDISADLLGGAPEDVPEDAPTGGTGGALSPPPSINKTTVKFFHVGAFFQNEAK